MSEERYIAAEAEERSERERLGLLSLFLDPITIRRAGSLGIRAGWHCLEVGAGGGSVARWMAEQVGPAGRVVATDLDPRFLRDLKLPNVEVRRHDILGDDLEAARYDLVHCRALLSHLPSPEAALARMVAALKPGGWLLAEEADYRSFGAADPGHPAAERFDTVTGAMFDGLRSAGLVDPYFGRRLGALFGNLELAGVAHEGITWVNRGGDKGARLTQMHVELARKALVAGGILTHDECDELIGICDDPSFDFVDVTSFAAWGRCDG